MNLTAELQNLRRELRERRRSLPPRQHETNNQALCQRVAALAVFHQATRVAAFLPFDGEPDPRPLFTSAGKRFYLPLLQDRTQPLRFARYAPGDPLHLNRYRILEPAPTEIIEPRQLELVLTPLVGFDADGGRLGVGGGYYDRSFAFLRSTARPAQPFLLGFTFESQRVAELPRRDWDVPLDAIATESGLYLRQADRRQTGPGFGSRDRET